MTRPLSLLAFLPGALIRVALTSRQGRHIGVPLPGLVENHPLRGWFVPSRERRGYARAPYTTTSTSPLLLATSRDAKS